MTQPLWFFGTCFSIITDHTTTAGQYDLLEGYFPPGKQTPLHRHTRYSEQLYVLEAEVNLTINESLSQVRLFVEAKPKTFFRGWTEIKFLS